MWSTCSIEEPCLRGLSETSLTERWIVTQSASLSGSITVSHTRSIGAAMSILVRTMLIGSAGH